MGIFGLRFFFLTGRFPFSGRNTPIFGRYNPNRPGSAHIGAESVRVDTNPKIKKKKKKKSDAAPILGQQRHLPHPVSDTGVAPILLHQCFIAHELYKLKTRHVILIQIDLWIFVNQDKIMVQWVKTNGIEYNIIKEWSSCGLHWYN